MFPCGKHSKSPDKPEVCKCGDHLQHVSGYVNWKGTVVECYWRRECGCRHPDPRVSPGESWEHKRAKAMLARHLNAGGLIEHRQMQCRYQHTGTIPPGLHWEEEAPIDGGRFDIGGYFQGKLVYGIEIFFSSRTDTDNQARFHLPWAEFKARQVVDKFPAFEEEFKRQRVAAKMAVIQGNVQDPETWKTFHLTNIRPCNCPPPKEPEAVTEEFYVSLACNEMAARAVHQLLPELTKLASAVNAWAAQEAKRMPDYQMRQVFLRAKVDGQARGLMHYSDKALVIPCAFMEVRLQVPSDVKYNFGLTDYKGQRFSGYCFSKFKPAHMAYIEGIFGPII
jgi:hypothetical protein